MFVILAMLAFSQPDSLDAFMRPGVSRELALFRAATISDVRYDLSLDVTSLERAMGQVTVGFVTSGSNDVILDFRGRQLTAVRANGRPVPLAAFNGAHLRIDRQFLTQGFNQVELQFVADIAPSGASIIRFRDRADSADYIYTLLVPADANQLFPCFDQPDLKARVGLTLVVPQGWTAIANGSVVSVDSLRSSGPQFLKSYRFRDTQPISTYLIAFAAGPFERASLRAGERTLTAYVRRSRAREADLDTLLAINARALEWMERWFDRVYPFEKFDFVLAPAFPFGGMEHPGAVFYSEDRFIFRERPTLPQRLGRMSTILHEVAHMWFGDLVTMRWFDDLWLKEGFATYMAAKALNELEPAADAWKTFHLANKPAAYGVDQTAGTNSLWQELANLDQAKSNYGAIVYNKAPSVLKQLDFLVGAEAFRRGVRSFLERYAYANATWRELLAVIDENTPGDLTEFGRNFMVRPGMPEVLPALEVQRGRIHRLALVQHPMHELSGSGAWPMRLRVALYYSDTDIRRFDVEFAGSHAEVGAARGLPAPQFVFANDGDHGYFLTRIDTRSLTSLMDGGVSRVGDPLLRALLWSALWDEVRAARLSPREFIELALRDLPGERDEQIAPRIFARLRRAAGAYVSPAERERLRPRLEQFFLAIADDRARPYGIRRAALDSYIDVSMSPPLLQLLSADSAAGEPVRDPLRWDVVARLFVIAHPEAEQRFAAQAVRDSTPDGRRRAFIVRAARRDAATKGEYFRRYFADTTLNEDWASGSLGAFNAPEHAALTLPYLAPALDSLRFIQANRRIFFLGAWLGAFMNGQSSAEALAIVRRYLDQELPADIRRKVLEYSDELERTVRIRSRWN